VTSTTTGDGIEVEVVVRRGLRYYDEATPRLEDVPADIRAALAAWLGVG
jgi:hypothetical protein